MASMKRILFIKVMALLVTGLGLASGVQASFQVPQTALDITTLPKYVTPLPHFADVLGVKQRVPAGSALAVSYQEFQQKVLPDSFYDGLPLSITP